MIWLPWVAFVIAISLLATLGLLSRRKYLVKTLAERNAAQERLLRQELQMAHLVAQQQAILDELRQQRRSQSPHVKPQGFSPDLENLLGGAETGTEKFLN